MSIYLTLRLKEKEAIREREDERCATYDIGQVAILLI